MAWPMSVASLRVNAFLRVKGNLKILWNVLYKHLHVCGALQVLTWINTFNPHNSPHKINYFPIFRQED